MDYFTVIYRALRILWIATVFATGAASSGFAASPPAPSSPSLQLIPKGPMETVFDWTSMHCEDWDVPDAPARAWRDSTGEVHVLASHFRTRMMTGPQLNHLQHACPVIFEGDSDDAPAMHDDRSWIAGTYSIDDQTIFALVHNEFQGNRRPALCPSAKYMSCWRNTLTLAVSHDGGRTFHHDKPPNHYIAGIPYRYSGDVGKPTGYFTPSNIIAKDGFYYAFFWAGASDAQRGGVCLMRTSDLADRKSWRAWDGSSFSIAFVDPYTDDVKDAQRHVCAPIASDRLVGFISSVTKHRASGLYVAVMATTRSVNGKRVSGIYSATSPDLIEWSAPTLVLELPMQFHYECSDGSAFFYPSLLDPDSPSRNFEDTGDHAYLYLTKIYLDKCKLGVQRDLVRMPVTIEAYH